MVAVAALAQGAMGMGFGQIAAAGMVWIAPGMMPATVIIMAFVVATFAVLKERSGVDLRVLSVSLCGRITGTLIALPLLLLTGENNSGFNLLFAVLLLASVCFSLFNVRPRFTKISQISAGLASGLMGTITSAGAPPMALVFQEQKLQWRARH